MHLLPEWYRLGANPMERRTDPLEEILLSFGDPQRQTDEWYGLGVELWWCVLWAGHECTPDDAL